MRNDWSRRGHVNDKVVNIWPTSNVECSRRVVLEKCERLNIIGDNSTGAASWTKRDIMGICSV
jgi:hypothetical protein